MPRESDAERLGERLEVLGFWKLWQQILGVDVEALLPGSGAEVQVQAPLETLVDVLVVRGNQAEGVKGARDEGWPVLLRQKLVAGPLLLARQVLLRWVVGLVVSRQLGLGRRDVGEAVRGALRDCRVIAPEQVGLLVLLCLLVLVPLEPPLAERPDQLDDLLLLPLGRHEAALGLWGGADRHLLPLRAEPVDVGLVWVDLHVRELALTDPHDHPQLVLAQGDLLVVVLVVYGPHRLAAVRPGQQVVQRVLPLLLQKLFALTVVA